MYALDTNVISDYVRGFQNTTDRVRAALSDGHDLVLCEPVEYEVMHGILKSKAARQRQFYEGVVVPSLVRFSLRPADWDLAAQFWADTTRRGRRLSDMDLLIAAVTVRLGGVLITADADFETLPTRRENWRGA